jgi:hypothetical protein
MATKLDGTAEFPNGSRSLHFVPPPDGVHHSFRCDQSVLVHTCSPSLAVSASEIRLNQTESNFGYTAFNTFLSPHGILRPGDLEAYETREA